MVRLPVRYLVSKPRKRGAAFYWQPTARLIGAGFAVERLSGDLATAIKEAEALNAKLDRWYAGEAEQPAGPRPGTLAALDELFQAHHSFKALRDRTRRDFEYGITAAIGAMGDELVGQITRKAIMAWVADQVANGTLTPEEARRHPFRNVITQALGNGGDLDVAVQEIQVKELDRILLCSDGLSGMIQDEELWAIVQGAPSLDAAAQRLVDKAMENGGEDNITVVLVAFDSE